MKKSTKILATVVAAATMLVGVVACSKKNDGVQGKYKATVEEMGMSIDMTIELKGDDKCTMTMDMTETMKEMAEAFGQELTDEDLAAAVETTEGTYAIDGETITFTFVDEESGEEETQEGTIKDGKITLADGEMEIVFKK